jgi:hypothetical protein
MPILTDGQIDDFRKAYNTICRLSADIETLEHGIVQISIQGYKFFIEKAMRYVKRTHRSLKGINTVTERVEQFVVSDEGENEVCCVEDWDWVLGEMLAYIARETQQNISINRSQFEDYLTKKNMEDEIDEDAREDFRESQRVRSEI